MNTVLSQLIEMVENIVKRNNVSDVKTLLKLENCVVPEWLLPENTEINTIFYPKEPNRQYSVLVAHRKNGNLDHFQASGHSILHAIINVSSQIKTE